MKLQLALDFVEVDEAFKIISEVADIIDIVEIGTPFILREGIQAVQDLRRAFPSITLLADLKIMDAGEHEATLAFQAGADIVTVLGVAHDATIQATLSAASRCGGEVMVDMIAVQGLETRGAEVDRMGVHYVCVHTAFDRETGGRHSPADLAILKQVLQHAQPAVAGGIALDTLGPIAALHPAIVVVGGAIMKARDRRRAALQIKKGMQ